MIEQVYARADDFDLIHFHIDFVHFPASRARSAPDHAARSGSTRRARAALPDVLRRAALVCRSRTHSAARSRSPTGRERCTTGCRVTCSDSTALPARTWRSWGVSRAKARRPRGRDRASPADAAEDRHSSTTKNPTTSTRCRACSTDPLVEFVGEIGEAEKNRFLGGAAALLFPIEWPEPFGLVMVEAMAMAPRWSRFGRARCPRSCATASRASSSAISMRQSRRRSVRCC